MYGFLTLYSMFGAAATPFVNGEEIITEGGEEMQAEDGQELITE